MIVSVEANGTTMMWDMCALSAVMSRLILDFRFWILDCFEFWIGLLAA